jgi:hypothetical protein
MNSKWHLPLASSTTVPATFPSGHRDDGLIFVASESETADASATLRSGRDDKVEGVG